MFNLYFYHINGLTYIHILLHESQSGQTGKGLIKMFICFSHLFFVILLRLLYCFNHVFNIQMHVIVPLSFFKQNPIMFIFTADYKQFKALLFYKCALEY